MRLFSAASSLPILLAVAAQCWDYAEGVKLTDLSDTDERVRMGAVRDRIQIKFKRTMSARRTERALGKIAAVTGCSDAKRTFTIGGEHKERQLNAGMHLFYELDCTGESGVPIEPEVIDESSNSGRRGLGNGNGGNRNGGNRNGGNRRERGRGAANAIAKLARKGNQALDDDELYGILEASPMYETQQVVEPPSLRGSDADVPSSTSRKLFSGSNDPKAPWQPHYDTVELQAAWDLMTDAEWERLGQTPVHVLDSGWDHINHEDLGGNLWNNPGEVCGNGEDDDGNGLIDDCHGWNHADGNNNLDGDGDHGDHCSGTISADTDNDLGVAGVAGGKGNWKGAPIMTGVGFGNNVGGFADAIRYAADNGAKVSSNSWGYTSPGVYDPAVVSAIDYATAAGVLVVVAAGNGGTEEAWYPGYYEKAIAVAATDVNKVAVSQSQNNQYYSNGGPFQSRPSWFTTCYGDWVDISAPGFYVYSTTNGNSYGYKSGTSMACPHVSGILALGKAVAPDSTIAETRSCLSNSADNIDNLQSDTKFVGKLGAGMVNTAAFIQCMKNYAPGSGCTLSNDCDDGNSCTANTCSVNGNCVFTPINCNDDDMCTEDSCSNGVCSNDQISCDDGDSCTADSCDSSTGCSYTPIANCCGNTICETGEDATNCLADCSPGPFDVQGGSCSSCYVLDGIMFDVESTEFKIQVQTIKVRTYAASGTFEVWTKIGTHVGFSGSNLSGNGWEKISTYAFSASAWDTVTIPLSDFSTRDIEQGEKRAFYVTIQDQSTEDRMIITQGTSVGTLINEDSQGVKIFEGTGKTFLAANTYSGAWAFNGAVQYLRVLPGTSSPTSSPTILPTTLPTSSPTSSPTTLPTSSPTSSPTTSPTSSPTTPPTVGPTSSPTDEVSAQPTSAPTEAPTDGPTSAPTNQPTASPTTSPTSSPTSSPTLSPTSLPTSSTTLLPTSLPTNSPTLSPTTPPTVGPTSIPTDEVTAQPTSAPTEVPTDGPTSAPTNQPTASPTSSPTDSPTVSPLTSPVDPTAAPVNPPTAAGPQELSTGNSCTMMMGAFTDLTASTDIVITNFRVRTYNSGVFEVWTRLVSGPGAALEGFTGGWQSLGTAYIAYAAADNIKLLPEGAITPLGMMVGQTRQFYLAKNDNSLMCGNGEGTISDAHLVSTGRMASCYSSNESCGLWSMTWPGRSFSGGIVYELGTLPPVPVTTPAPPTVAPPTAAPPTILPPTASSSTAAPPTNVPPTAAPPTNANPPTNAPACTPVEVIILTDNYPWETTWSLFDSDNTKWGSGGPYDKKDVEVGIFSPGVCVPDNSYTFTINDAAKDGVCCGYGQGSYEVKAGGEVVAKGGKFRKVMTHAFTLPPTPANFFLTLTTDKYGSETSWFVSKVSANTEVLSGDGYASSTTYSVEEYLSIEDCYTFTIRDSFGDGICCSYGEGSYSVTFNDNVVKSGGKFSHETSQQFGNCPASAASLQQASSSPVDVAGVPEEKQTVNLDGTPMTVAAKKRKYASDNKKRAVAKDAIVAGTLGGQCNSNGERCDTSSECCSGNCHGNGKCTRAKK
eukprot:CAMPEP_0113595590 /NCGR_PEP_ID=MMETSP0015_2-20120614/39818_1 /TAXON_ID=2838 /ORGANISM="Odontella" /LENGTH=1552 /DNA_ID=CAMNT_0000502917 /DNA_START=104 /DNA_END=4762 /DNA_ORIENTATION=+ /assembly_acc=CAM_ASM_000160